MAPARDDTVLDLGRRYRDLGPLAAGAMGEVRRVWDQRLECAVAMKILHRELVGHAAAAERFRVEARITARLQHPGIVSVHDRGELADGRPWYTMSEVRGQTLEARIEEAHRAGVDEGAQHRLVSIVQRVCEAMGYAHRQEVVHRDLKPSNVMIGAFGEVLVMDWGLARRLSAEARPDEDVVAVERDGIEAPAALTRRGAVLGTPAYMAPEQARGERAGFAADVYALGGVLYAVLSGRAPLSGAAADLLPALARGRLRPRLPEAPPLPDALREICHLALAFDPEERYPNARVLGLALDDFLAGARRRVDADAALREAGALRPGIDAGRRAAAALRAEAGALLAALQPHDPAERKVPAWALLDAAAATERDVAIAEVRWERAVGSALELLPRHPAAEEALAEHHAERLLDADTRGDPEAVARAEALLAAHDRGRFAALLTGTGRLTLVTEPPGAEARLFRFVERGRRLEAHPERVLGHTPLVDAALERGSWLVELALPGHATVRYPVFLGRGEVWDGVRPGGREAFPIALPRADALGPDDVLVPAGWFWSGGDPEAGEPLPRRRVWVDAFVMRRFPVTVGEYRAWLDALDHGGRAEEARARAPRRAPEVANTGAGGPLWRRDADGWRPAPDETDDMPVVLVDWHDSVAFAEALAARTGQPWRLPAELEWEKAARGVDGRPLPWGRQPEPTWAAVLGAHADAPRRVAVDSYPVDTSPYGVRGLAGNVRDRCVDLWQPTGPRVEDGLLVPPDLAAIRAEPGYRAVRGGSYHAAPAGMRAAGRLVELPHHLWTAVGFRVVRPI